ncbi:hypothetical protein AAFF_G00013580 [Aldrovandia affinis]|uniref:Uncharacterized protein n=1 Tax=Aldrovandia affinis TaxID=143900 RepID=A0AAD7S6C9_9TELE|nr:hypothetical protein AAFF_G00013580 [Aldrovandia affinis]
MASDNKKRPSLKEDLTCVICHDLFNDPVMLACMHHFCRACISTYWRGLRGAASCPQCRQEFPSRQLQTNYLVAGMVDKVRASSSDGYLENLQKQLQDSLESHRTKREEYLNMMRRDKEKVDTIKRLGVELQVRVRGEFQALQEVLREEEARVLGGLQREEAELLEGVERRLERLGVWRGGAEVERRRVSACCSRPLTPWRPACCWSFRRPSLQVEKEAEIDLSAFTSRYSAPLQYVSWRKMFRHLKPSQTSTSEVIGVQPGVRLKAAPAPLTFDPETAHPNLCLSRDHTSVVECQEMLPYKRSPKRFTQCVNVLAAQGFLSGRHYWEVGVAGNTKWDLGVALETVDRRARAKLSPENGYWALRLRDGGCYWAGTQPWTPLRVEAPPRAVGVFLDCEEHRVCFYNADSMQLLYTFSHGPRGHAYPFFSTCVRELGQKAQPIRLLHFPSGPL